MLKLPVLDVDGEKLGVVNDFGIATGEVFPHVTSLAFRGPGKTPFMISWRKWVDRIDETGVHLKTSATEIRFSYLQPTELLLARDVLNKQIVDTQGMKVVRVNDIKFPCRAKSAAPAGRRSGRPRSATRDQPRTRAYRRRLYEAPGQAAQ